MLNDSCFISQLRNTPLREGVTVGTVAMQWGRRSEVIFLPELIPSLIQGPKHTSRNHPLLGGSIGRKLIIRVSFSVEG